MLPVPAPTGESLFASGWEAPWVTFRCGTRLAVRWTAAEVVALLSRLRCAAAHLRFFLGAQAAARHSAEAGLNLAAEAARRPWREAEADFLAAPGEVPTAEARLRAGVPAAAITRQIQKLIFSKPAKV